MLRRTRVLSGVGKRGRGNEAELAKVKFEYDGRFYDYELELREGRAEYEYKIDAQTGEIVEVERD